MGLYVHAGLLPEVAQAAGPTPEAFNRAVMGHLANKSTADVRSDMTQFFHDDGPFWTRRLALGSDVIPVFTTKLTHVCSELDATLTFFGASRMVVGHTAQDDGKVHHRCDGRLVLADTLISDAYTGESHPSAVEVLPSGEAFAMYPAKNSQGRCMLCPGKASCCEKQVLPRTGALENG